MRAEIEEKLAEYIRTQVLKRPKFELERDDPLISSGLIDSFHLVDLAVFIDEVFGVHIDDTELNMDVFDTIGQLAEMVERRMDQHAAR